MVSGRRTHEIQMKSANDDLMKNDASFSNGDDDDDNDSNGSNSINCLKIRLSIFHRQPFLQSFCLVRAIFFCYCCYEKIFYFTTS